MESFVFCSLFFISRIKRKEPFTILYLAMIEIAKSFIVVFWHLDNLLPTFKLQPLTMNHPNNWAIFKLRLHKSFKKCLSFIEKKQVCHSRKST